MKISSFEYNSLLWFIIRAGYIGLSLGNLIIISERDFYLSGFIALILGFIPLFIYYNLRKINPRLNYFELNEYVYGKFGKFINLIELLITFLFVVIAFQDLVNFVNSQFLFKTKTIYIAICFIIPIAYSLFKGIDSISKTSLIMFYFVIVVVIIIIVTMYGVINIDNLKPFLQTSPRSIFHGSSIILAYNVLPTIFLLAIPRDKISNYNFKKSLIFYVIAIITLINAAFMTIGSLGLDLSLLYEYPEFNILKKAGVGKFINRLESILSMEWVVGLYVLITMGSYFINENIKSVFKKTNNLSILIICLLILIFSHITFLTTTEARNFLKTKMIIIMFIGYFLIPLITLLIYRLKKSHNYNCS